MSCDSPIVMNWNCERQGCFNRKKRLWKCPLCLERCRVTYDELAENGVPVCDTCGLDMILVDE